jgi:hypothetical protein
MKTYLSRTGRREIDEPTIFHPEVDRAAVGLGGRGAVPISVGAE